MGSKNLKAIVVRGTGTFPIADEPGLNAYLKDLRKEIVSAAKGFGALGTAGGIPTHDKMGNWPIKNWQQDHWPEAPDKISGAAMRDSIMTGRYYCGNCIIGCGRTVQVKEGPYAGIEQGGLEYETTSLNGSNLLIDNLAAVQKLNEMVQPPGHGHHLRRRDHRLRHGGVRPRPDRPGRHRWPRADLGQRRTRRPS